MEISFHSLKEDNLSLLHRWFQEPTIKNWYAFGKCFSLDDIKKKYLPRIQGKDNTPSYIANLNKKPVGFIQYYALSDHLPSGITALNNKLFEIGAPDKICGIDIFIADSQFRGVGHGKRIINQFIDDFLSSNFNWAVVDPAKNNLNAIRCYEKSGFRITDYSNANTNIIMIRNLICGIPCAGESPSE